MTDLREIHPDLQIRVRLRVMPQALHRVFNQFRIRRTFPVDAGLKKAEPDDALFGPGRPDGQKTVNTIYGIGQHFLATLLLNPWDPLGRFPGWFITQEQPSIFLNGSVPRHDNHPRIPRVFPKLILDDWHDGSL
jgi:hypothetical protein